MVFNPLTWMLGRLSQDIGIDLGTANTLVTVRGRGIVIDEPSVVAINRNTKTVLAIGAEAKRMVGRTPANIVAVRPLKDGVISDFDVTEKMLQYFIRAVHDRFGWGLPRPRVVVGMPSGATEVEKRAIYDATISAGAREAFLIEEPLAAAIGAGLPIMEASGSMVVDIGGGTTEVAVCALGGIVVSSSIRVAGDEVDLDIVNYARQVHNMLIGERSSEEIKIEAGSAFPLQREHPVVLRGRDLSTGLPKRVEISSVELRDAISGSVSAISDAVRQTIEITAAGVGGRPDEPGHRDRGRGGAGGGDRPSHLAGHEVPRLRGGGSADLCRPGLRGSPGGVRDTRSGACLHGDRARAAIGGGRGAAPLPAGPMAAGDGAAHRRPGDAGGGRCGAADRRSRVERVRTHAARPAAGSRTGGEPRPERGRLRPRGRREPLAAQSHRAARVGARAPARRADPLPRPRGPAGACKRRRTRSSCYPRSSRGI